LHLDRDIARDGVDVRGQQDGVAGGRADVPDLVDPRLPAVRLEEVDEALRGLLLLARGRGIDTMSNSSFRAGVSQASG